MKNKMKDAKKRFSLGRLFYNDKFVLVFSVFLAFLLWIVMAFTNTEKYPHTIPNVPVKLDLSAEAQANKLTVFSPKDFKVTVKVTGNSLIVNSLKAEDITVTPQGIQSILTSGVSDLILTAQSNANVNMEVVPNRVQLYVDYSAEKTFAIDPSYSKNGIQYKVLDGFYMGNPTFSAESITVSGPRSEVARIAKVTVACNAGELSATKQLTNQKIVLLDESGQVINGQYLTFKEAVDVTFTVQPQKTLQLKAEFTGQPSGLIFTEGMLKIEPTEITVAAPAESFQNRISISLKPKSFSAILPKDGMYSFSAEVDLPPGFTNIDTVTTATVTLDLRDYESKVLNLKNIKVSNLSGEYQSTVVTKTLAVTVVGPKSELEALTDDSLVGTVDMSGKSDFTGSSAMSLSIAISGTQKCWIYGDDYKANVTVKKTT